MAKKRAISFSRRMPDNITEELVVVLSSRASFEFKPCSTSSCLIFGNEMLPVEAKRCCVYVPMKSFRVLSARVP